MIPPPPISTLFPYTTLFRSILMLLAVYGVRSGEVGRLQLTDIDWQRETITFTRSKMAGTSKRYCFTRSEEHTSELQSRRDLVCRLLLEKKKKEHQPTNENNK